MLAGALIAVLLMGCGDRGGDTYTITQSPTTTASAAPTAAIEPGSPGGPSPAGQVKSGNGKLAITVIDQNNRGAEWVPVEVSGLVSSKLFTNPAGEVSVDLPAGRYRVEVPAGCTERIIVESGGGADVGLASGQTARGRVQVRWRQRIAPGEAAYPSKGPVWRVNDPIEVAYDMVDRCENRKAENSEFPTFRFEPSANLEITQPPVMRSDHNGQGRVHVTCRAPGKVALVMADSRNPSDRADLATYMVGFRGVECTQS